MSALHKILVVDDDPVVGRSFNRVLSEKGYLVVTADNAQEALTKLQDAKYDAVFTDIRMPGMDGLELAEQVKAKHPWTPVVIVTGYGTTENEERAKAAGVSAFLRKPLSPEMIEGSAANALLVPAPAIVPPPDAVPAEAGHAEPAEQVGILKTIALFMAAPFIGLAYVLLFPFVGMGLLGAVGIKKLMKMPKVRTALHVLKNIALFIVAPFVGLAYIIMFPIVGAGMLAWMGVQAIMKKPSAK